VKIAFVLTGGLHPSGREQVIPVYLALLERLGQSHDVHAFTVRHLPEPGTYRLHNITVHDLGRPGQGRRLRAWHEWRALRAALAGAGPFDLLHAFWINPAGLLATAAGRRLRVPVIVTCDSSEFVAIDNIDYGMQRTRLGRALVSVVCRRASRVHVQTKYMQQLAEAHHIPVVRLPIGVDTARFAPVDPPAEGPPWKLLQVASLNRVKDQTILLDAVSIAARTTDVRLDLVGEDTLNGRLQANASRLGIADRVTFHGYHPSDWLPRFYRSAHIYVQSSRHEAAAASVLEAAASGLPIVGTRVGYLAELAPDAGVATTPGDAPALARAIVETLHDRSRRARLAANARAFAAAHDVNWTATQFEQLYQSVARPKTRET